MMFIILAALALASGTLAREQFIIGGGPVDIADFPWQGSYRTETNGHICGCVFVGGVWVLTAGHCGGSSAYSMEFGETNRGTGTVFDVSSVARHPEYEQGAGITPNDISIVQATSDISGSNISPATIAANSINPGGNGWITGWGRSCADCYLAITLLGTEIPIINDQECSDIHGVNFQSSNMICVWGGIGGEVGSCNGDSGGPLTVGSTLYGLTSWGMVGCDTDYPSVYNRVGAFNAWICSETNNGATGC